MAQQHWHVQRHNEDDDVYATEQLASALNYAADQLDRMADFEHDGISANGEQGEYEEAYRCYQRSESYNGLMLNARNIYKHGTVPAADRAPVYRDEEQQGPLWQKAAVHIVEQINMDGPRGFQVWQCAEVDCAPTDDD